MFYSLGYTNWDATTVLAGWAEGWGKWHSKNGKGTEGISEKQCVYMLNRAYPKKDLRFVQVNKQSDLKYSLPVFNQATIAISTYNKKCAHVFIIIRTGEESYTVFDPQGGWQMSIQEYYDWNWSQEDWNNMYDGKNLKIFKRGCIN